MDDYITQRITENPRIEFYHLLQKKKILTEYTSQKVMMIIILIIIIMKINGFLVHRFQVHTQNTRG